LNRQGWPKPSARRWAPRPVLGWAGAGNGGGSGKKPRSQWQPEDPAPPSGVWSIETIFFLGTIFPQRGFPKARERPGQALVGLRVLPQAPVPLPGRRERSSPVPGPGAYAPIPGSWHARPQSSGRTWRKGRCYPAVLNRIRGISSGDYKGKTIFMERYVKNLSLSGNNGGGRVGRNGPGIGGHGRGASGMDHPVLGIGPACDIPGNGEA